MNKWLMFFAGVIILCIGCTKEEPQPPEEELPPFWTRNYWGEVTAQKITKTLPDDSGGVFLL